ncbi:hypothetical protein HK098_000396 [Nowakowskiella sp. JEL0407]|nr:hypothetical protein HK098_000396 [Nowakowskiella sp. JEL0407]
MHNLKLILVVTTLCTVFARPLAAANNTLDGSTEGKNDTAHRLPPFHLVQPKSQLTKRATCSGGTGFENLPIRNYIDGGKGYINGNNAHCIYKGWTINYCSALAAPSFNNLVFMQGDNNFVLYHQYARSPEHGWDAMWSTNTFQPIVGWQESAYLTFQADGNVVLYENSRAKWSTGTAGRESNWFCIQDDANVVLYDINQNPIWASNTAGGCGVHGC